MSFTCQFVLNWVNLQWTNLEFIENVSKFTSHDKSTTKIFSHGNDDKFHRIIKIQKVYILECKYIHFVE